MTRDDDIGVLIGLSAVVFALDGDRLSVLTTHAKEGEPGLPFGPFDPGRHRTFELALRAFVTAQTGLRLGFVEQLYTFGDAGRETPRATPAPGRLRVVSVGYLALTRDIAAPPSVDARWREVTAFFPWEDRRAGRAPMIDEVITPRLEAWAASAETAKRRRRVEALFALDDDARWNESAVLDRYELLYEAGLVAEAERDGAADGPSARLGQPMESDHRRILATGLGRLRSKLKYRPVLFDLAPETFTLSQLQTAAEAVSGLKLHKQNFRRGVERTGLVTPLGRTVAGTGGRPAELFAARAGERIDGHAPGLALPALR
ncbi:NUDIX hydrolase [Brevundimonas balnearis]|uniref:NAD regulator n=1 Tax=Brevundimonas balnearis TaxID=1572858 RepID=A0ABV6R3N2_9CAUL